MAIKGLTDQRGAFPRIGKLRKGAEKPKNGPGKDLDHFRFDSPDAGATAAFQAAYGNEPRSINVRLPYPTMDENWQTAMEKYGAGGLEIRCDREFMEGCRVNGKFMKCFPGKSPCQRDESKKDGGCGCKEVGRLNLIIPELQRFAYVTAETHSINDLVNLTQQLTAIEMTFGQLNGIPLVLTRRPEQISTPTSGGGRARREKWMLSIEVSPEWASRQLAASDRHALSMADQPMLPGQSLALPAPPPIETEPLLVESPPQQQYDWDFLKSDLWLNIQSAFASVENPQQVEAYVQKALDYVQAGQLPKAAKGRIEQLQERAYQKLSDRRPPAHISNTVADTEIEIEIDPNWREDPLWEGLMGELAQCSMEEAQSFVTAVNGYVETGELPPAAGQEILKMINKKRAATMQPAKAVQAELV